MIRKITPNDLPACTRVIQNAFAAVADEFRLTPENCPTHAAFITVEKLTRLHEKGVEMFAFWEKETPAGFIAIEASPKEAGTFFIEKLTVLPEHRHRGVGRDLMECALEWIAENGGRKASIGIINEHTVLKEWYRGLGFRETATKTFSHLPFTVCFMERVV